MALYKKDVIIKPNSTVTLDAAITSTINFLNNFQNASSNKDANGNYKDYFFADLYDSRTNNLYKVFSDGAVSYYSMPSNVITQIDTALLATKSEVNNLATQVQNDISALNTSLSGQIQTVSDNLATTNNNVAMLGSRLNTDEANITALQAEVEALKVGGSDVVVIN